MYHILRLSKGCYVIASYILGIELGCISPSGKDFKDMDADMVKDIENMAKNIPPIDKVLILNTALDIFEIQNLEGKVVDVPQFKQHMLEYYDVNIRLAFEQGWFNLSDFYQTDLN
jgi:hypothetical protein